MKKKCMFTTLSQKLHSEKGTAAIITLSVILVLTALGTVSLLASAMNVRMSGKTVSWSKDFYTLDAKAESYVHMIDETVLIPAERDARIYVINRLDKAEPGYLNDYFTDSIFSPPDDPYDMGLSGAQNYFNSYYLEIWTYESGGVRREYTLSDYEQCLIDGDFEGKTIDEISPTYTYDASLTPEEAAAKAYKDDLRKYTKELFDRVYFHMAARRLELLHNNDAVFLAADIVIKDIINSENYGYRQITPENRCTYVFNSISVSPYRTIMETWDYIEPENGDIVLYILARDTNVPDMKVHVEVEVIRPNYEAIEKTIYTPVYGNPIWANALTVRGSIGVGNTSDTQMTIKGDVYASGTSGITLYNAAAANIHGNVYTAGNVQAVNNARPGNGGRLRVFTSETGPSGVSYAFKEAIYGNGFLHDSRYSFDPEYTADQPVGTRNIPFIFRDIVDKGNVYCESLEVAENVLGASLTVDGNLWTMDDIQMDGQQSVIEIGTTEVNGGDIEAKYSFVGLNAMSSETDPNKSSSVINNFPFNEDGTPNSSIILNSNFLVPGVAFYNFYDSADPAGRIDKFYKSVESITSRTANPASILNAYLGESATESYYNQDGDEFNLIGTELDPQKLALVNFVYDIGGVYTNVKTVLSNPEGDVAGVALIEKHTGAPGTPKATVYTYEPNEHTPGAVPLVESPVNRIAFSNLTQITEEMNIFKLHIAKTKKLGTYYDGMYDPDTAVAPIAFGSLVDAGLLGSMEMSEMVVIPAGGTLNISAASGGITSGIVYCRGNVTITGDGSEFRGAIICDGNVSIEGNVNITYDEEVIRRKLKSSIRLREFFRDGEMGDKLFDIEEYSTTSGRRIAAKRHRVTAWRELPKDP